MNELIKIYDSSCDVCALLSPLDEQIAEEFGMYFMKVTIGQCAKNPSTVRDYVVKHHVDAVSGMVDIPLYLIKNQSGAIETSGVAKSTEELRNMIEAWKQWEYSQK